MRLPTFPMPQLPRQDSGALRTTPQGGPHVLGYPWRATPYTPSPASARASPRLGARDEAEERRRRGSGRALPPCGVPAACGRPCPSSRTPAVSHFQMWRTTRGSPSRCSTHCTSHAWSIAS
jgi:hypothetical protein